MIGLRSELYVGKSADIETFGSTIRAFVTRPLPGGGRPPRLARTEARTGLRTILTFQNRLRNPNRAIGVSEFLPDGGQDWSVNQERR